MHKTRRTLVATSMAAALAAAGVTAAIAADPAPAPPPRIAFLANGVVPADALAAGPIAGQLGAPVYTTQQDSLPAGTADALDAYDPELVIVMGGPIAIAESVVNQVAAATDLAVVDPSPTPTGGVVRAAGADRFETATIVADLLAAYSPAYLPVDRQAVDADLLDGKDSSAFLGTTDTAADAELLDGLDSDAFGLVGELGRVAAGELYVGEKTITGSDLTNLNTVVVTAPSDGFVLVNLAAALHPNSTTPAGPCVVSVRVTDGTESSRLGAASFPASSPNAAYDTATVNWVFPVTAGTTSFTSQAYVNPFVSHADCLTTPFGAGSPQMTALFVPFAGS